MAFLYLLTGDYITWNRLLHERGSSEGADATLYPDLFCVNPVVEDQRPLNASCSLTRREIIAAPANIVKNVNWAVAVPRPNSANTMLRA